jgi:eukaryotic-like serine/threonine-protein kinase
LAGGLFIDNGARGMRYRAFISYSHADEAWARWLMRRLETYRVPPRLVGRAGIDGPIGARLGAFFRDRDELTASSDLSTTIRSALDQSSALIVLCSPSAAGSRWVDAEVRAFRDSGRGERILAFVVAGEPGQPEGGQACFPPSLMAPGEHGQTLEPLAADARREADGRQRAFLKLVAGLLGVGFDQLAQREAQRKQRKLVQVAAASLAGMALAIGLAATAHVARNDAQRRQAQAEDILGFMLGDLREKLTTVGRIDLMRAVDDKAAAYFASLDPRDLSDRALEEQARSLTGIGQVRLDEGKHAEAMAAFQEALERSTALYERAPENGQRLYDRAQAEYWIGYVALQQGDYDTTENWFRKYHASAVQLAAMDPGNFDWQKEVAYGLHNLAVMDQKRGHLAAAEESMQGEIALFLGWLKQQPDNPELRFEAADSISWMGSLALAQGRLADAESYFSRQVEMLQANMDADPDNSNWKMYSVFALNLLTDVQKSRGRHEAARARVEEAIGLASPLLAQDPANNEWRATLARCHLNRSELDHAAQPDRAMEDAAYAETLLHAALAAEPKSQRTIDGLARAHQQLARLALSRGDLETARAKLAASQALLEPAWQDAPNETLRTRLAENHLLRGELARKHGHEPAADSAWMQARQLLLEGGPDAIAFDRLDPLLRAQIALRDRAGAARSRQRLDAAGYQPLHPFPADTSLAAQ